jgi:hypothetical protein
MGAKVVKIVWVRRIEEELLDRIDGMLKAGELKHAPPDYWAARRKLLARRRRVAKQGT